MKEKNDEKEEEEEEEEEEGREIYREGHRMARGNHDEQRCRTAANPLSSCI